MQRPVSRPRTQVAAGHRFRVLMLTYRGTTDVDLGFQRYLQEAGLNVEFIVRDVQHDASRVAARLGQWLERTAQCKLSPQDLAVAYHDAAMWQRTTLDDRAIVLAGRSLPEPAP